MYRIALAQVFYISDLNWRLAKLIEVESHSERLSAPLNLLLETCNT